VRVKYRISGHLYDAFFKYHLAPKLSDFLVEERRREAVRNSRKQARWVEITANQRTTEDSQVSVF
jgi:hypothetical protein